MIGVVSFHNFHAISVGLVYRPAPGIKRINTGGQGPGYWLVIGVLNRLSTWLLLTYQSVIDFLLLIHNLIAWY
jgi:hypothetical protein